MNLGKNSTKKGKNKSFFQFSICSKELGLTLIVSQRKFGALKLHLSLLVAGITRLNLF
jgi:hypothetical protein